MTAPQNQHGGPSRLLLGRRDFLRLTGKGATAAVALGGLAGLLAACGDDEGSTTTIQAVTTSGVATTAAMPFAGVTIDYMGLEGEDALDQALAWRTENGVELQSRYVAGVDEVIALLTAGTIADVATSGNPDVQRLAQAGLIMPIDTSRLSNWNDIVPKLRDSDFIRFNGDIYAVPFAWGDEPYIFVPERLPREEIPSSILGMQDPKWAGRIVTLDSIWLLFGLVSRELFSDRPTDLSLEEFAQVVDETRPIMDNMVAIAGSYGDATDFLVRGEADINLNGWEAMLSFAADKGVTVDFGFFDTSTLVWSDSYVLPTSSEDVDAVYAYMDEVISPETNAEMANYLISGASNAKAADLVAPEVKALFDYTAVTDASDPRDVTDWLPPAEPDEGRAGQQDWTDAWLELKA